MPSDAKVTGPASYFPSIEETYGMPVARWFEVLDALQDRSTCAVPKPEDGLGHANALVADHRARGAG